MMYIGRDYEGRSRGGDFPVGMKQTFVGDDDDDRR
jgi:hypothetical protein